MQLRSKNRKVLGPLQRTLRIRPRLMISLERMVTNSRKKKMWLKNRMNKSLLTTIRSKKNKKRRMNRLQMLDKPMKMTLRRA